MKFQNTGHPVALPSLGIGLVDADEVIEVPDEIGERMRTAPNFREVPEPEDEDAEPIAARRIFGPAIPAPVTPEPADADEAPDASVGATEAASAPAIPGEGFRPAGRAPARVTTKDSDQGQTAEGAPPESN